MNKSLSLAALAIIIFAAGCKDQDFKKTKDGAEYKVYPNQSGQKVVPGDFIQLNILAKYKDSTLFSSIDESAPRFIPYDTVSFPEFFRNVNEGDSLVVRQSTDSIMKTGQGAPWMQKGQYIYQNFKIVKVFKSKEAADSASKAFIPLAKAKAYKKAEKSIEKEIADNDSLMKKDDATIKDYMAKNNIQGEKTKWGTYVAITTPGTGPNLTENDVAVVNYTGKTFNDSTFDSNTDKRFGHVEPLDVDLGQYNGIIPGWVDGLKMMKKGSKGKILIPSILAYGPRGRAPKIGPNEPLVFDIEVTDLISQDQYNQEMETKQKQMQMMQQQMMQQQMEKQKQQQNSAPPNGK